MELGSMNIVHAIIHGGQGPELEPSSGSSISASAAPQKEKHF